MEGRTVEADQADGAVWAEMMVAGKTRVDATKMERSGLIEDVLCR